jgi:hypothetical protein
MSNASQFAYFGDYARTDQNQAPGKAKDRGNHVDCFTPLLVAPRNPPIALRIAILTPTRSQRFLGRITLAIGRHGLTLQSVPDLLANTNKRSETSRSPEC